jgi:hypothetical protein
MKGKAETIHILKNQVIHWLFHCLGWHDAGQINFHNDLYQRDNRLPIYCFLMIQNSYSTFSIYFNSP